MVPKDPGESLVALNRDEQVDSTVQPTLLAGEAKHSAEASTKKSLQGRIVNLPGETMEKAHCSVASLLAAVHRC